MQMPALKIIRKNILTIAICLFFCLGFFTPALAAEKNLNEKCTPGADTCKSGQCLQTGFETYQCILFAPQVEIPGVTYVQPQRTTEAMGKYISGLYSYFIGITAIIATVVLMIGGFQWVTAGGNTGKIGEAQSWIIGAISGLVLAFGSYFILNLISPNLVNFKIKNIPIIGLIKEDVTSCCAPDGSMVNTVTTINIKTKNSTISCPKEAISCDTYCTGKANGTKCNTNGYCFNDRCLIGNGEIGEPCGAGMVGVCAETCLTTVILSIGGNWIFSNPSKYIFGRDCGSGLWCCAW